MTAGEGGTELGPKPPQAPRDPPPGWRGRKKRICQRGLLFASGRLRPVPLRQPPRRSSNPPSPPSPPAFLWGPRAHLRPHPAAALPLQPKRRQGEALLSSRVWSAGGACQRKPARLRQPRLEAAGGGRALAQPHPRAPGTHGL